ncbi:MAG TPA: hypothetical protein VM598_06700, partial [Bdellovibrionota bacterium]|nr:hypothetical protein [Bdellovibrionota bacterium]
MKTRRLAAITFIVLVSVSTARADAASKAQLLDQFVKLNAPDMEQLLRRTAEDMVNRDPRIQPADRG